MKDRYLIAVDLDGTLLKDNKTISERTKKTIEQVQKEGHIVMISTGRPYRSSSMYYQELNLRSPIVNFNGAFVHHPLNNDWGIYHETLDIEVAKTIVETSFAHSFQNIVAEVLDKVFIHYHDEKLLDIFALGNPKITTGDLRKFLTDNPTSLLIQSDENNVKKIRDYLSEAHAEVVEHRNWGAPFHVIEIIKHGINKATGIQKVADFYNITQDRIIAFGDEDNDLEMLQFAKYGVAMDNGIAKAKEAARDITLSNEKDGVAVYLEKMLLS